MNPEYWNDAVNDLLDVIAQLKAERRPETKAYQLFSTLQPPFHEPTEDNSTFVSGAYTPNSWYNQQQRTWRLGQKSNAI